MLAEICDRCEAVEECYEFLLAYAAQGLPSDQGSKSGGQVRDFLHRAVEVLTGLPEACAMAVKRYATFLVEVGRDPEALAEIERARQLNPSSTPILADKGFILIQAGKIEEARSLLTQLTLSQPDFTHPHRYLADLIYFPEGDYAGYFKEKRIVARLRHDSTAEKKIDAEEKGYTSGGLRGLLKARLTTAQDLFDRSQGSPYDVASAHAALGENDDALKYLQIAYLRHDLALITLPIDKAFQPLRQNQEFRDLVAKIGLPPIN